MLEAVSAILLWLKAMGLMSTVCRGAVDKSGLAGDSEPDLSKAEPRNQLAVRQCEQSGASA